MRIISLVLMVAALGLAQSPNYFYTTLTNTITSTDTTCTMSASDTTYFGSRTNFYATIWDTYYSSPSHARSRGGKYETVLIESRSGLTLQIVRAQMSSTAQNFNLSGRTYRISVEPLNNINDSITSHNTRINASIQRSLDSIAQHRTEINALTSLDSVDIPIVATFAGASFGSQSTVYSGINGAQVSTSEASVNYPPFGIGGRVIGMYFQSKTNTCTSTPTITFQYGDSSASSLTASNLAFTLALGQKSTSLTGKSITVTPTMLGGFKYVNSSGSGSITFPTLTIVIRTKIN